MNKSFADLRNAVPLPASCPTEFRTRIADIRAGKKLQQRKPVAAPVAAPADDAEERERHTLQGALAAAIITLL